MAKAIVGTLSEPRFFTYLCAAGHSQSRALDLYLWNAKLGAAFHLPIQAAEVAFRNRINQALVAEFGADWWQNHQFVDLLDHERTRDIDMVLKRIGRRNLALDTGQVVAGLSFGFWVGMMHGRYNRDL
jgi:hypothetical protein